MKIVILNSSIIILLCILHIFGFFSKNEEWKKDSESFLVSIIFLAILIIFYVTV